MASEDKDEEKTDAGFLKASSEARRLEREAIPAGTKVFPSGAIFEELDVEKISIDSYEVALQSAKGIEGSGIKIKRSEKEEKAPVGRIISDEELQRIPQEKVEVLARSEEEIVEEERKLRSMKDKFAKLILEIPKEKPKEAAVEEAAVRVEEKPAIDKAKAEEIKELSDNFKKITMKKDEMEKRERIRKMKKEIEDMLESG